MRVEQLATTTGVPTPDLAAAVTAGTNGPAGRCGPAVTAAAQLRPVPYYRDRAEAFAAPCARCRKPQGFYGQSTLAGDVGVNDDVVEVVTGGIVERSAAGHQAKRRESPYRRKPPGWKRRLARHLGAVHCETRRPAVRQPYLTTVTLARFFRSRKTLGPVTRIDHAHDESSGRASRA